MTKTRLSSIGGLLLVAVIGYSLPWLWLPGVSLQPGAYDLAEWASLHPFVRGQGNLLLPALLLRFPLLGIGTTAVMMARLDHRNERRVLLVILALGIGLALIPPVAFFQGQWQDPNYRQIFILWLVFGLGSIALLILPRGWLIWAGSAVLLLSILSAIGGIYQTYGLMAIYELPLRMGSGSFIFVTASLGAFALLVWSKDEYRQV